MSNLHYPGNKRGNIPVSNDKLNEGLVAERVSQPLIINGVRYDGSKTITIATGLQSGTLEIRTLPTRYDLPNVGDPLILYSIMEEGALYMWDINVMHYVCIGRDYEQIDTIDGGSALNG